MKAIFLYFIFFVCLVTSSFAQGKESLQISLPNQYNWKIAVNNEDSISKQILYVPGNESLQKWSVLVMMTVLKNNNFKARNITSVIKEFTQSSLQESSKVKVEVVEKNETSKNFWAIFKIKTPDFPNDPVLESQLWHAIQNNSTLYVNFVAIKQKILSDDFIVAWSKIFKSSKLMFK